MNNPITFCLVCFLLGGLPSGCFIFFRYIARSGIARSYSNDHIAKSYHCFPGSSAGEESACNAEDLGLIPDLGRPPGEGNSNLFQHSGLENSMDYTVHGVTKSRTQLSDFHFHFFYEACIPNWLHHRASWLPHRQW